MQVTTNTYLKSIDFLTLVSWDVKAYLSKSGIFNPSYSLVLFGEFLKKPQIQKVKIDDEKEYKILGVRSYGKGSFANRTILGKTLKMREYQQAKANHLFWCKVDTKNGAFGVITDELADGVASSNMTFAEIDTSKINVDFLQLLFKSKGVMQYLDSFVTGTTNRKYIRPDQLINEIKIPLPSLPEQEIIVNNYYSKIKEAEALEKQANDLEGEIERYLFHSLGVKIQANLQKCSLLQFVNFEDTNRWDSLFLLGKIPTLQSKYQLINFAEAIKYFNKDNQNKSIRVDSSKFPNDTFRYIGMEHIEKETGILLEMPILNGKEIKSQTIRVPKDFFIYGKLRPYLNKYWINRTEFDNIICSSEFFVFDINETINKEFFKYVLSSKIIQDQISDKTSGARMPRINEEIFFDLKFPLPPKTIQDDIAQKISDIKSRIEQSKANAFNLYHLAEQEFEQSIFSE